MPDANAEVWSWLHSPEGGCLVVAKDLGDGRYAGINPLLFYWTLIVGAGEPGGWFRNVRTGRRRPDGDPAREYVAA